MILVEFYFGRNSPDETNLIHLNWHYKADAGKKRGLSRRTYGLYTNNREWSGKLSEKSSRAVREKQLRKGGKKKCKKTKWFNAAKKITQKVSCRSLIRQNPDIQFFSSSKIMKEQICTRINPTQGEGSFSAKWKRRPLFQNKKKTRAKRHTTKQKKSKSVDHSSTDYLI